MARSRRRRVRRNSWKGHKRAHRLAARRGWRRRRRASNPRRRYRRGRRFNPVAAITRPLGALTAGFNVNTLKTAGVLVAGGLANAMLSSKLIDLLPVEMLKSKPGYYIPRLASAGILSGLVKMVAPKYAGSVLTGAVMQVGLKAVGDFFPSLNFMAGMGDYLTLSQVQQARPLAGLGDYLTSQQVAGARPLMTGLGYGDDWLQEAADSFENGAF